MKIGCPKEIKPQEFRVGMTPNAAQEAVAHGHSVVIQTGAGIGAGFPDADYTAAGAEILDSAEEIFATADMIVKVKEPQAVERKMLREGQLLFTYLHLAGPTPGTPPISTPRPPLAFCRVQLPTCGANRPATSDMGASKGKPPAASVTVS